MARQQAELADTLRISWLKKHGYLDKNLSFKSGGIKWTCGFSGGGNCINFSIKRNDWETSQERTIINLYYTHTDHWNREKSDMNYDIELTATPCNYGGTRYWFVCPLIKNGKYCGKRVGVIYRVGKWFGCRHCADIAYMAQFEGGKFRVGSICEPDVERAYGEVRTKYYKGKPTRKYKRYLSLRDKMDDSWIRGAKKLGINF